MGFTLDNVLGDENHYTEFVCPICAQLVEDAVLTPCSHVFCGKCLSRWREVQTREREGPPQDPTCPSCNQKLPDGSVRPLHEASPLGARILGRVRCRCPLGGCDWEGDYGGLQAHLINSETHAEDGGSGPVADLGIRVDGGTAAADTADAANGADAAAPPGTGSQAPSGEAGAAAVRAAAAEGMKEQGNHKFRLGQFRDAIQLYSRAVALAGGETQRQAATYLGNRAACWFKLGSFAEAAKDCRAALAAEPLHAKCHARLARALCELGEFEEAGAALRCAAAAAAAARGDADARSLQAAQRDVDSMRRAVHEGRAALAAGQHTAARAAFSQVLRLGCGAACVVLWSAEAELGLGRCDRALRVTRQLLRDNSTNQLALALRGRALFADGDFEQAEKVMRQALRLHPDDNELARRFKALLRTRRAAEAGRAAHNGRNFEEAAVKLGEALSEAAPLPSTAPLSATLHAERAAAHLRCGAHGACLRDCAVSITACEDHRSAWLTRCSALEAMGKIDEALEGLKALQVSRELGGCRLLPLPVLLLTSSACACTCTLQLRNPNDKVIEHRVEQCEKERRRLVRPDYYAELGVPQVASEVEIKHAYKQRALEVHPDRHAGKTAAEVATMSERFKLLGEALELLGDPMKRKLYDEGFDKAAIAERVAAAERAAANPHAHRH